MKRIPKTPKGARPQVLSPTASAMIDASTVVTVVFLLAIAALMLHRPELVTAQLRDGAEGQAAEEPVAPAVQVEIRAEGLTLRDGPDNPPRDIVRADLVEALATYRDVPGPVGLCVAEGIPYHEVRDLWWTIGDVLGNRDLVDCGGRVQ